jgi:hypothetical protein
MIAFNEIALRPTGVIQALGNAFAGLLRNVHKLFVFGFCLFVAFILLVLVLGVVFGLIGAALSLLGPKSTMIGFFLLEIPFLLVLYPLMFAGAYCMWKSFLGDAPTQEPAPTEGASFAA